jgi:hypothetical protein
VEVEHREQALTSENEGLKKDLENARTTQRFQDSVRKKLAELQHDTEASMAMLGRRSTEFPTNASLSDFFEWFRTEVTVMPTVFVECNKNITCYALIAIFSCLQGKGENICRS